MQIITLPGLIDPHVHLRDPGQTHKEDFYTGTSAALAGGYTTILDMPNNKIPITTLERLEEKIKIAKEKIVCDVGFYFGSMGDNLDEFSKVQNKVMGLKLYLNETTGNFLIDKKKLEKIFSFARSDLAKLILLHAEDEAVEFVIKLVGKLKTPVHFCHISTASDLQQIIQAKEKGLPITCGVTPHHLFLNDRDAVALGPFGKMKPALRPQKDIDFLWKHLNAIDVVESDHAPHTIEEKLGRVAQNTVHPWGGRLQRSESHDSPGVKIYDKSPYGVPGLETTLPLLLTQVSKNKISLEDIIRLCHASPAKIFGVPTNPQTKIEVNLNSEFLILNSKLHTKYRWSPFEGWKVKGKVQRVFLRGKRVFEDGKILTNKGTGQLIYAKK